MSGWNEPDAILMIAKDKKELSDTLFHRGNNEFDSKWHGDNISHQDAENQYAFDQAFPVDFFSKWLEQNHTHYEKIFVLNDDIENDQLQVLANRQIDTKWVQQELMHMRLIKDEKELDLIKKACEITCEAHNEIIRMNAESQFRYEYEIDASFYHQCMMQGASGLAYNTIVGGGSNACILHYTKNDQKIEKGSCILIDAGCQFSHYSADVSRTWPISGTFSNEQRLIYDLVLAVQREIIQKLQPGVKMKDLQEQSQDKLIDGLIQLGIVDSKADKKELFYDFYGHALGHSLGLDVHDPCSKREDFVLKKNMVITIEPGCYLRESKRLKDKRFQGMGIRIEDNIHILENGNENLTKSAKVMPEEIESMAGG